MPATNIQPEFRHTRSGSLTIVPQAGPPQDAASPMSAAAPRFDGPRSPPNTAHVPCKFFRQGACQAGNSCPFSHDIGAATETVCKYFAKGNCKFGPKCANIHVLPDGRRVNYGKNGVTIGTGPLGLGGRINPAAYLQPSNSALTNSFLNASGQQQPAPDAEGRYHTPSGHQLGRQPSMDGGLPVIDTTYSSNPTSAYGSPPGPGLSGAFDDHLSQRGVLGLSPMNANVLSVMDAPLPASFDSNGISHAARYGPWPSSVPSKFGLDSPSPSLHNAKDERTSETLKLLHTSAFGHDHLSPSNLVPHDSIMGSSPTAGPTSAGGAEEYYGRRIMHSSSTRYAKPRLLSSSAPKVDRDWDTEFWFLEEDYVPGALANEVLTPQEKARRGSIRLNNDGTGAGVDSSLSETPTQSASASANATKFGSPATSAAAAANNVGAASPSRWSPWLQQRQQRGSPSGGGGDDDFEPGSLGRSMKHAASAFGHVGSPLRNSSLATHIELNGNGSIGGGGGGSGGSSGDLLSGRSLSSSMGGSRSVSAGGESMSVLTQQLQRTRLGGEDAASSAGGGAGSSPRPRPHPSSSSRHPSASLSTATVTAAAASGIIGRDPRDNNNNSYHRDSRALERHVSSGSIGSSSAAGRFPAPIDEEDPSFLFDMEEVDDARALKRKSAGGLAAGSNGVTGSSSSGSLWSYAGIVSAGNGSKGATKGRDASNGVEPVSR